MRATRRLRAMQRRTETMHTLTLRWYAPTGARTTGADGMEHRTGTDAGTTAGKVQANSMLPGNDMATKTVKVGSTELPVLMGKVHIGVDALLDSAGQLRLTAGWECVVEALGPADDPALLGDRYRVVGVPPKKSHMTARRLDVVDVTHLTAV